LLPLANTPLIEYTLEFLATAGVGEVYVTCCAHTDQVEEYIKHSKWNTPESPFVVHTIALPESLSVGDVMRDLDTKGLIKSDFLVISGDVVCNIDFAKVLKAHKDRKTKDKNAIMTIVLREASALHRTRQRSKPGVFIFDQESNRCLRYEVTSLGTNKEVAVDAELLAEHETISIRNDLIDCQIDICTQDVPALFTENFDYDHMRSDFVRGILTSDILGKTIYAHILDSNYAGRVQSIQTYDAISKDIISRYTYPITPDVNFLEDQTYHYQKGHIYKEDGVVLAQSCTIANRTMIGSKTFIGHGTLISQSVIGRRCKIGRNVKIESAYIWDDVIIEDDVIIKNSIIADNVVLKRGAVIEEGAIVSYGVIVGTGCIIPRNTKLTARARNVVTGDSDDSETEEQEGQEEKEQQGQDLRNFTAVDEKSKMVGPDGEGFLFHDSDVEDDDDEEDRTIDGMVYGMSYLNISDVSIESIKDEKTKQKKHKRTLSTASATTNMSEENDQEEFFREAIASIERSIMDNHEQDIALLELNTLRMTMNAPHEEVRRATVHALVSHIGKLVKTGTMQPREATQKMFKDWKQVLSRLTPDASDRVELLLYLQRESTKQLQGDKILFYGASTLYDVDLVEEDNVYAWWGSPESTATDSLMEVRNTVGQWVDWLKNAEEESDEE
jgi:translation initiation factor eIF-2B subunit epsilon